jgi:aspartyl-tRNA(Asn)/glutamyl-tRNA(Gln) amidotransferase subunit A
MCPSGKTALSDPIPHPPFSAVRDAVQRRSVSVVRLTREALRNIDAAAHLNAFITVLADRALEKAEEVDRRIADGSAGRLAGMVVAVKDLLAMRGVRNTCGSRMLDGYVSPYDATAVERLEAEDAVVIGKTNMDEFGMGSSNENSAYGPVRNPFAPDRIPGGSSGGSAAAVAAGMAMAALGTDTGGSVRQPAALTGTVGLRPTYGRVSRYGLVAFASSLDTVGCFARSVEDCAAVLQSIAGADSRDATCSSAPVPEYASFLNRDVRGMTVGLPSEYLEAGLHPDIRECVESAVDSLSRNGANVKAVSLPHSTYGIATYYLICTAEASSNLARYDGVRFGMRKGEAGGLEAMTVLTRSAGFGEEVVRRIMLGTYVLSAGYYEAYYRKAQKVRTLIRRDFDRVFETCEAVLGPTTPTTAFRLGEKTGDPLSMYLSDVYTVNAPLAGLPAISIPAGTDSAGLPIGIQLTGKPFGEGELMATAHWLMHALGTHPSVV